MPTETDPRLPAARGVDSPTARTPAVISPPTVARYADEFRPTPSPALADDPGAVVEPYPDGWATDRLSPLAQRLHGDCCDWGGDVAGHGGVDFELEAARERANILGEAIDSGELIHPATVKAPVETKVWAGTWGTLGATVALALVNLLLVRLDVLPSMFGGNYPWMGPLVLVLGVVLPPVAQFIRAWLAEHTPRPDVEAGR